MTDLQELQEGKVLLIDKPLEWTSFDAVKKIRTALKIKKVGHAGTLDPLATGLLIICTGKFTKKINEYMGMPKTYTGTITIGSTTPTFDLESAPDNFIDFLAITPNTIVETTQQFLGNILQYPPQFSAIKKDGKPLYLSARKGIEVAVEARPVDIYSFDITNITLPIIEFKVVCSTGTYIRSLANDFGKALSVGAHLSSLRRTHIGDFCVDDAYSIQSITAYIQQLQQNG